MDFRASIAALGALAVTLLAGCAAPGRTEAVAMDTHAMGAGPACELRVDVGGEHRCELRHVAVPDAQTQLMIDLHRQEVLAQPR